MERGPKSGEVDLKTDLSEHPGGVQRFEISKNMRFLRSLHATLAMFKISLASKPTSTAEMWSMFHCTVCLSIQHHTALFALNTTTHKKRQMVLFHLKPSAPPSTPKKGNEQQVEDVKSPCNIQMYGIFTNIYHTNQPFVDR